MQLYRNSPHLAVPVACQPCVCEAALSLAVAGRHAAHGWWVPLLCCRQVQPAASRPPDICLQRQVALRQEHAPPTPAVSRPAVWKVSRLGACCPAYSQHLQAPLVVCADLLTEQANDPVGAICEETST